MRALFKFVGICVSILLVLGGIVYLWASRDIVTCPVFDKELAVWFPYTKGEALVFDSKANQTVEKVVFDSLRVQHRSTYDAGMKCGTCGDLVEAVFALGRDTLRVSVEGGDAMFANTTVTNLNSLCPRDIKEGPTTMLLSWSDSANPSGITQALLRKKQGLVWFERNKQRFYYVRTDSASYNAGQMAINEIPGCQ